MENMYKEECRFIKSSLIAEMVVI